MAKKKKKQSKKPPGKSVSELPLETRASEALTVFWTVTVLMVLVADVLIVALHWYLWSNPEAEKLQLLEGLLLFSSALVGGLSLAVLPILFRIRQVPPPTGLAVFGACVCAAPILAAVSGALL